MQMKMNRFPRVVVGLLIASLIGWYVITVQGNRYEIRIGDKVAHVRFAKTAKKTQQDILDIITKRILSLEVGESTPVMTCISKSVTSFAIPVGDHKI